MSQRACNARGMTSRFAAASLSGGSDAFSAPCLQMADERPVSSCQFVPSGDALVCGSWSGNLKVLGVPDLATRMTVKAHDDRITGECWDDRQGARRPHHW